MIGKNNLTRIEKWLYSPSSAVYPIYLFLTSSQDQIDIDAFLNNLALLLLYAYSNVFLIVV